VRRRTVGRIGGVYGWALGGCLQQGHTGSHSVATVTAWWRCGCGKTATARGYASTGKAGTYRGLRHPSSTRRWQAQGRARQRRRRQQGTRCIGSETKCSKNHFITTNYLHGSLSSPCPLRVRYSHRTPREGAATTYDTQRSGIPSSKYQSNPRRPEGHAS